MGLFNELSASLYLYMLVCLTDYFGENSYRETIGWYQLCLVCLVVGANILKTVITRVLIPIMEKVSEYFKYIRNIQKEGRLQDQTIAIQPEEDL